MKRMSEVFNLPVSVSLMGDEHAGEITQSGEGHYCLEDNNYWMLSDFEHAQHAAHAINHVDALADALGALVDAVVNKTSDDSINNQIIGAAKALAAYRGEE